jgi:hypothetical protein
LNLDSVVEGSHESPDTRTGAAFRGFVSTAEQFLLGDACIIGMPFPINYLSSVLLVQLPNLEFEAAIGEGRVRSGGEFFLGTACTAFGHKAADQRFVNAAARR